MRYHFYIAILATIFMFAAPHLVAGQSQESTLWSQFRGNFGTGIAPAAAKPVIEWEYPEHARWTTDIPGVGWSSPVISDGKIWLTTAITTEATPEEIEAKRKGTTDAAIKTVAASVNLRAVCVSFDTGEVLHDVLLAEIDEPELINPLNSYASPTPAIKSGKVVCHFGNYGTWCLDNDSGEVIWKKSFIVDHSVGPGSSPIVYRSNVILVCDGTDKQFVVAVNLEDGVERWRTNRPPIIDDNPEFRKSYGTPFIVEISGKPQAVIPTAKWIASYDPENGQELWRAKHGDGFSIAPMPVYESGLIIFSTGYTKPEFVAVDPTGAGDVTDTHIKWRSPRAPTMPSLISKSGQVIAISEKGILNRLDSKTGKSLERMRLPGNYSASPVLANNHLYFCSREGVVYVVKLEDGFKKVATNRFGESIMASPAISGNDLIIRTKHQLVRLGRQ